MFLGGFEGVFMGVSESELPPPSASDPDSPISGVPGLEAVPGAITYGWTLTVVLICALSFFILTSKLSFHAFPGATCSSAYVLASSQSFSSSQNSSKSRFDMAVVRVLTKLLIQVGHWMASLTDLYFPFGGSFSLSSFFTLAHQSSVARIKALSPSASILASPSRMRIARAFQYFATSEVLRYWGISAHSQKRYVYCTYTHQKYQFSKFVDLFMERHFPKLVRRDHIVSIDAEQRSFFVIQSSWQE
jgi:hypothetical protein